MKPPFGVISRTYTNGAYPTIANMQYWVKYNSGVGVPTEIGPVKISNRRPVNDPTIEILPAMVGDVVGLFWGDNDRVACQIIEGIATSTCGGAT